MSHSIPKLKKGMKVLTRTKQGKFFHPQSALMSTPVYRKRSPVPLGILAARRGFGV